VIVFFFLVNKGSSQMPVDLGGVDLQLINQTGGMVLACANASSNR